MFTSCATFVYDSSYNREFNIEKIGIDVGRVYGVPVITEDKLIVFGSSDNNIYFFEQNGELSHIFETGGEIHASAGVLSDGAVVLGSYDGFLYYFSSNGELLESIEPGGTIYTRPAESEDGIVIIGLNKRKVLFHNRITGEIYYAKAGLINHGSPVVLSTGEVVIGSMNSNLYYLDIEGNVLDTYKAGSWIQFSKVVELEDGRIAFTCYDGYLYLQKRNLETDRVFIGGAIHSSPLLMEDGTILVSARHGGIAFVSPEGEIVRRVVTDLGINAEISQLSDGTYVTVSSNGTVVNFDRNGDILARIRLGERVYSSPLVLDEDRIFIVGLKGGVYLLNLEIIRDHQ